MMSYQDVARDMRRFSTFFQSVHAAADALEQLGSIEQATKEATAARDKALAERDDAEAHLARVRMTPSSCPSRRHPRRH